MATALARDATVSVAEIIHDLEAANDLPEAALRLAVPHAAEVAPAILELAEKAARGVHLMPRQENLFFWGIHVLAAARRTELYRPLLRLLAQQDEAYIDGLIGDAVTETLASIVISIFDGDPDPLIDVCADRSIEGAMRWNLMTALARLTFDCALPRERTLAFLDRFERESLAVPGDIAWIGWAEAIKLLALEEMRERVHATWRDGRSPEREPDQRVWDEELTLAHSLAPGDPGLFARYKIAALDDPVAALRWTAATQGSKAHKEAVDPRDPAAIFALEPEELRWLKRFFYSRHVRPAGMVMEMVDGFFYGLIACPVSTRLADYLPFVWSPIDPDASAGPDFDSPEQAEFARSLLARHWQTISLRLNAGFTHDPVLERRDSVPEASGWAFGFVRAVSLHKQAWTSSGTDPEIRTFVTCMTLLAGIEGVVDSKFGDKQRTRFIEALPLALQAVHDIGRGRSDPLRQATAPAHHKIGRNEPCPCGSGKKYKRCCAASV